MPAESVPVPVSDSPERGVVRLRQKPAARLAGREGYVLPEDAGLEDFLGLAGWVGRNGGHAPYLDENGVLVVSHPGDEDADYEFVQAPSLLVFDPVEQDFSTYGHSMLERYDAEEGAR